VRRELRGRSHASNNRRPEVEDGLGRQGLWGLCIAGDPGAGCAANKPPLDVARPPHRRRALLCSFASSRDSAWVSTHSAPTTLCCAGRRRCLVLLLLCAASAGARLHELLLPQQGLPHVLLQGLELLQLPSIAALLLQQQQAGQHRAIL
jgi:hypothetical protein